MKKYCFVLILLLLGLSCRAQVLLDEGFDNGIPERWKMFNDTNTTHNADFRDAWNLTNDYGLPAPAVISASWFETPAQADRWLITDTVFIPDSGYVLSVDAAAYEQAYADGFAVKVSQNGNLFRYNFDMGYLMAVESCGGGMESHTASLDKYVGKRIHIAIIQNSNDKNFLIVDNIKVYKPEIHAISLPNVEVPEYVIAGSPFIPQVTVHNSGMQTIYNLHVDYYVGGDTISSYFDNLEIFPNGVYELTLPAHTISTTGEYPVTFHAYFPNGIEDNEEDNFLTSNILVYEMSQTVIRHTIMEEFSDLRGGYSVAGHNSIAEAMRGNVHCSNIVHHANSEDVLCNAGSQALRFFYSDTTNYFTPGVMIDRRAARGSNQVVIQTGSSSTLQDYLIAAQMRPCFLRLSMDQPLFSEISRQIGGTITGRFMLNNYDTNTRMVVYLVEDSVYSQQFDYSSGNPEEDYTIYYRPSGIVRDVISSAMGDTLSVDSTGRFSYSYSYKIPSKYRAWRCKVVAIVYHLDSAYNQCYVHNSVKSMNASAMYVGIDSPSDALQAKIFPNPATDEIHICSPETIEEILLLDPMGRSIQSFHTNYEKEQTLDVSQLCPGIYFVAIKTAEGTSTQKIVIAR